MYHVYLKNFEDYWTKKKTIEPTNGRPTTVFITASYDIKCRPDQIVGQGEKINISYTVFTHEDKTRRGFTDPVSAFAYYNNAEIFKPID